MNRKVLPLLIVIILGLSGCTNGSAPAPSSVNSKRPINMRTDFKYMTDFIGAMKSHGINCLGLTKRDEIMVKDAGDCKFNGQVLSLTLFASDEAGNQIYDAMKSLMSGYLLSSNNWWIQVEDESTAKLLEDKLGVSVR